KMGEVTSTNPIATIFAWSGEFNKRGEIYGIADLVAFGEKLEKATIDTVENGEMTGDLAGIFKSEHAVKALDTVTFLQCVAKRI
ncbi:MAG: NADP-dependent isocitrate dehydrogenase, partial [Clostridia bacterium]